MIEVREGTGFVRRAEVLVEPIGHHDLPVGVEARDEQKDHVVENFLYGRRIVGCEAMHELERHLRGADFVRVNAACDQQHELPLPEDCVAFAFRRRAVLEVQLALHLLVAAEIRERVGRADFEDDERVAAARPADLAIADSLGPGRRQLHVVHDAVPPGEPVVGADFETQHLLGRPERTRRGPAGADEQRDTGGGHDK